MTKKVTTKVDELREVLKGKKAAEKHTVQAGVAEKGSNKEDKTALAVLKNKLKAAEESAKKNHDSLMRIMAEFENYKKRTTKEKSEQIKFANEKILQELLPVLDDLERVFDHISEDSSPEAKNIMQGVGMVQKSLLKTLKHFGLAEIEAQGMSFNPNVHEALGCIEAKDCADDTVVAVHRKGYKLGDRVIRAAQVTVAKNT